MRSKTGNIRRATQDLDIDFIRYSLSDEAIDVFIEKLNCLEGILIRKRGEIESLKQQDYHGKRVYIDISDTFQNHVLSKIDLGVHKRLEIEQEEYCFDIAFDEMGASLLINSNEQMFSEKLRSLLRFGPVSTRYKDIFDMYYLSRNLDREKLAICMDSYIYNDPGMREKNISDVLKRVKMTFRDRIYRRRLASTDKNWIGENMDGILQEIVKFLKELT